MIYEIKMAAVSAKRTIGKMRVRQWGLVVCTYITLYPRVMPGSLIRLTDNCTKNRRFRSFLFRQRIFFIPSN